MSGTKNNRELYKAAFSKLHASEAVIRKEEKMLKAKKTIRFSKLAAACMSVALLVGATSGIAYAATDGATANPFKAVKIYINGEELDAAMQKNEDGSYTVHMKKGDRLDAEMADGSTVSSSLSKQAEDAGYEADFTVTPDGTEGSFSITDGDSDTGAKAEDSHTRARRKSGGRGLFSIPVRFPKGGHKSHEPLLKNHTSLSTRHLISESICRFTFSAVYNDENVIE